MRLPIDGFVALAALVVIGEARGWGPDDIDGAVQVEGGAILCTLPGPVAIEVLLLLRLELARRSAASWRAALRLVRPGRLFRPGVEP